jgi:mannose-6-phosphate isomerase-like protein (cupin superfamily)
MRPMIQARGNEVRIAIAVLVLECLLAGPASGRARADAPRAPAAAPVPYFVKTAASLADLENTMQGPGPHNGSLLKPGATALEIVWRHEEDYEQKDVELHDGRDHVFFVTDGRATLTLGGELVAPREVSPGEWKAASSRNSQTVDVAKGDLIFIPHGTAHGRSAKGRHFTMLQLSFWPGGAPAPRSATGSPATGSAAGTTTVPAGGAPASAAKPPVPRPTDAPKPPPTM